MSQLDAESFNPYSAPLSGPEFSDPFQQDDTRIRQQFIDCEANLKTIAGLLTLGGVALAGACMLFGFVSLADRGTVGQLPYFVLATLLGGHWNCSDRYRFSSSFIPPECQDLGDSILLFVAALCSHWNLLRRCLLMVSCTPSR